MLISYLSPLCVCEFFVLLCNSLINFPCSTSPSLAWWGTPSSPYLYHAIAALLFPDIRSHLLPTSFPTLSFLSFLLFLLNFLWLPFSVSSFSCSLLGAMLKVHLPLVTPPALNSALLALIKVLEISGVLNIKV